MEAVLVLTFYIDYIVEMIETVLYIGLKKLREQKSELGECTGIHL